MNSKSVEKINKPDIIANKVRYLRNKNPKKSILILEGSSDEKFFKQFIDENLCKIQRSEGKNNALGIISILKDDANFKFVGILAVVDSDYDLLLENKKDDPDIIYTDFHDIETMLINSPAFDKLISVCGGEDKVNNFKNNHGDIKEFLLEKAKTIGSLRYISQRDKLFLDFDEIKLKDSVDVDTLEPDITKIIKDIKKKSVDKITSSPKLDKDLKKELSKKINETDFISKIEEVNNENYDLWHICCGHDILEILLKGFKKLFATFNNQKLENFDILSSLLLAYIEHFSKTNLYDAILKWQDRNNPYMILKGG